MERVTTEGKREAYPETRWLLPLELSKQFSETVHAAGFAAGKVEMEDCYHPGWVFAVRKEAEDSLIFK